MQRRRPAAGIDCGGGRWLAALLAGSHSLINVVAGKFTFGSFVSLYFILKLLAKSSRKKNSMSSSGSRWSVLAGYPRGLGDLCCQTYFAVSEVCT